jgi:hypothetical protein
VGDWLRRVSRWLPLAGAVLAIAGCGNGEEADEGDPAASRAIRAASAATLARGTARQHIDFRTEPDGTLDFSVDGLVDFEADDERGTFTYRAFPGVDLGTKVDIITVDEIDYIHVPGESIWLKTKTTEQDAISNATDIPSSLRYFGDVTEGARAEGSEIVRGVRTTRYRVTVGIEEPPPGLDAEGRERYKRTIRAFKDKRLPAKVWIDKRGLIRRIAYTIEFATLARLMGREDGVDLVAELYDFGVPAHITPPPPERTEVE